MQAPAVVLFVQHVRHQAHRVPRQDRTCKCTCLKSIATNEPTNEPTDTVGGRRARCRLPLSSERCACIPTGHLQARSQIHSYCVVESGISAAALRTAEAEHSCGLECKRRKHGTKPESNFTPTVRHERQRPLFKPGLHTAVVFHRDTTRLRCGVYVQQTWIQHKPSRCGARRPHPLYIRSCSWGTPGCAHSCTLGVGDAKFGVLHANGEVGPVQSELSWSLRIWHGNLTFTFTMAIDSLHPCI